MLDPNPVYAMILIGGVVLFFALVIRDKMRKS